MILVTREAVSISTSCSSQRPGGRRCGAMLLNTAVWRRVLSPIQRTVTGPASKRLSTCAQASGACAASTATPDFHSA